MVYQYEDVSSKAKSMTQSATPILMFDYGYPDGFVIKYHWHEWIEIIYIFEGNVDVYLEGKVYSLVKGEFIFIPSGTIHETRHTNQGKVLVIQVQEAYLKEQLPEIAEKKLMCCSLLAKDPTEKEQYKEIAGLLVEMYAAFNDTSAIGHIGVKGSLAYTFYKLYNYFHEEELMEAKVSEKYRERLLMIFEYVHEHSSENISLGDLADYMALTPQYLSKIFRKYLDTTFKKYVSNVRLERAHRDVSSTDKTFTDIALTYGFPNYQSFVKEFREKYNMRPSAYRKQAQEHMKD